MWALRAQTDKLEYAAEMRRVLEATPNLYIREAMVTGGWSMVAGSTGGLWIHGFGILHTSSLL